MGLPINPDCSIEHRCGNCRRDLISASVKKTIADSRTLGDRSQRKCNTCKVTQLIDAFRDSHHSKFYFRKTCRECRLKERRERDRSGRVRIRAIHECTNGCGRRVQRKNGRCLKCYRSDSQDAAAIRSAVRATELAREMHPCTGGCGFFLSEPNTSCRSCIRARQDDMAKRSEHLKKVTHVERAFRAGKIPAMMCIGEERWSLSVRCARCGKPKLMTPVMRDLCYTCATGQSITLQTNARSIIYNETESVAA